MSYKTRADELFMLYIEDSYNLRTHGQGKLYSVLRLLIVGLYFHRRMSFFKCELCPKTYQYERDLKRHVREKHTTIELALCKK